MYKPNGLDRQSLQTQLENYKLIAEVNQELLEENLFPNRELHGKLELAQTYINESEQWEKLGEQTKCHDLLTDANIVIVEVGAAIKLILTRESSSDENILQLDQS